jgi:homoserine kinase
VTPFEVVVPCSTSNLGAGFDALGIALGGPRVCVRVEPGGNGLRIASLSGEGADSLPRDATNRVLVAAHKLAQAAGRDPSALRAELHIDNTVPLARGLGSSAAAAVAGALVADALLDGAAGQSGVLAVAVGMEGHPDNVVPTLMGGAQVAIKDAEGATRSCPVRLARPLRAAIFIPDEPLATSEARAVVPKTVSLGDAVFNLGRAALFVAALAEGSFELLGEAMADRLHQPARTQLMPWLPAMIGAARAAGAHGAALSGAGTTICSLCDPDTAERVAAALGAEARRLNVPGRALAVDAAVAGARLIRG